MTPSMYIFPTGIGAWSAFTTASVLCLVLAWRASVCCTKRHWNVAAAYASAFSISLSLLFLCLDLPFWAAGQILFSSVSTALILLCAAKEQSNESLPQNIAPQQKLKATIVAAAFLCLNCVTIIASASLSERPLANGDSTLIFPQTDYAFRLNSYDALENLFTLALRICLNYPYLVIILTIFLSALIATSLMVNFKTSTTLKTDNGDN